VQPAVSVVTRQERTTVDYRLTGYLAAMVLAVVSPRTEALAFTKVAAGEKHTCAITDRATLMCWGNNNMDQLGLGPASPQMRELPTTVPGLTSVTDVAVGTVHTCAIATGEVWCWGLNNYGQLGTDAGPGTIRSTPERVPGAWGDGSVATAVATSSSHTCAVVDGGLWCWGRNHWGQAGQFPAVVIQATPWSAWPENPAVASVSVGDEHSCALSIGKVWCWGRTIRMGTNAPADAADPYPALVTNLWHSYSANVVSAGAKHACTVANEDVFCWGSNDSGQLGSGFDANAFPNALQAVPVAGPLWDEDVATVSAGKSNSCAITASGATWCWGDDGYGQLGNGDTLQGSNVPVPLHPWIVFEQISVGGSHVCAIEPAPGRVTKCWGRNDRGQLGTGTVGGISSVPVAVDVDTLFVDRFDPAQ
jgi:alpha-tubulin suppressor-like RCC1 family protein